MTLNYDALLDNAKKKIDDIINISLDRIELIPETKEIRYYVTAEELYPDLLRISPIRVKKVKRLFEIRGLKVDIVNKKHFRVTYNQENVVFNPEQAQRNLDILMKQLESKNK